MDRRQKKIQKQTTIFVFRNYFPLKRLIFMMFPSPYFLPGILKYKQIKDWEIFLPSQQEILADLSYLVYIDFLMEVPKTKKNLGHSICVGSISSGSTNSITYLNSFMHFVNKKEAPTKTPERVKLVALNDSIAM